MTMQETATKTSRTRKNGRRRLLERFLGDRSAATAVEFALVGGPFFLLLLGITEVTTTYFAGLALDNGMMTVARQIRTGEVQSQNLTAQQFKTLVCDNLISIFNCDGNLYLDVRVFQSFNDVAFPSPIKDGQVDPAFQFDFDPGVAGDIVLVRGFYVWHIATPGLSALANLNGSAGSGGDRLLEATQVFRNEPFAGSSVGN